MKYFCALIVLAIGFAACKQSTEVVTPSASTQDTIRRLKVGDRLHYTGLSSTVGKFDSWSRVQSSDTSIEVGNHVALIVFDSSMGKSDAIRYEANGDVSVNDFTGGWFYLPIISHDSIIKVYGSSTDTSWNRYFGRDTMTISGRRVPCVVSQYVFRGVVIDSVKKTTTISIHDTKWSFAPSIGTVTKRYTEFIDSVVGRPASKLTYLREMKDCELK
jgi:hypothetical protein